jgi:LuxR family maltose regulon positive regulatory protein
LTFLLERQSANMHIVLTTREDPLLPISRLRARAKLLEIRQDDLSFTVEETAEFLRRVMGLDVSLEAVAALERRTEGWIAGLQLAALSLRGHADAAGFIQDFTGSSRFVLDYLIEEVFERQSPDVKSFLLKTSVLERLCVPLCNTVISEQSSVISGQLPVTSDAGEKVLIADHRSLITDSRAILEYLEHSNLFIVPLDQSRTWYRYHRLFQELLRHRLRLSGLNEAELQIRASQWYEAQGFMQDAVEHSLAAQDWGRAAQLIGVVSDEMFKRGEVVTLLNWCGRLPQQVVYSDPRLCLVHAWAALMTSQFDIAALLLERAEQLAEPDSHFLGEVASAQAFLARAKRDSARAIQKSEQALALLPDREITARGTIAMNLGLAYWHEGRLREAEPVLLQACELCGKAGNTFALLTAQIFLARIPAAQGKLHQAAGMSEELIRAGGQIPILCLAHYDLATIQHEWNNLPKAMEHFEQGFALSQRSGNVEFQQAGHLLRAILAHAQGDDTGAMTALAQADAMAHDFPVVIRSRTAAFGVQLALARNDSQMLAHWSAQVNAEVDAHSFYRFMGLTRPRLLIAQGKKDEAAKTLKAIYQTASESGWDYGMIIVRILQSLAAKTTDEAMQFISDALHIGKPEGFIRSFLDAGSAIIPILQEAARRGIEAAYVSEILAGAGEKAKWTGAGAESMIEALSGREMEVLRLVTAGMSNREIAAKLIISTGTAKTHIHHVCGKLGVRNRTEAAVRARELGLV